MRYCAPLLLAFVGVTSTPAAEPQPGLWRYTLADGTTQDHVETVLKLEKTGAGWTGKVLAINPDSDHDAISVKSVTVQNGLLRIVFRKGSRAHVFEAATGDDKVIRGSDSDDRRVVRATMYHTTDPKMTPTETVDRPHVPAGLVALAKMNGDLRKAAAKARQVTDETLAKQFAQEIERQRRELLAVEPRLLREALRDAGDSPSAYDAGMLLLRITPRVKPDPSEVTNWALATMTGARHFGPKFTREIALQISEILSQDPAMTEVALAMSERSIEMLEQGGPHALRARALATQAALLERSGKSAEAKKVRDKLELLESLLDDEYARSLPRIDGEKSRRKRASERVVLMELFTGAQCPPCLGAEIAYDKLRETYGPTEVIGLQYHLHRPGPDPLSNPDANARWEHYLRAYAPKGDAKAVILGTPTAVVAGKPTAPVGGSVDKAASIYQIFKDAVEPLLDQPPTARIALTATRQGDAVGIDVRVTDVPAGPKTRLYVAAVEETVRYQGANGVRYHHDVVRTLPSGADGELIDRLNFSRHYTVNVGELRGRLNQYLDDYARTQQQFPRPDRPLKLAKLRVIAWVQDDATHAIGQAAAVDVP